MNIALSTLQNISVADGSDLNGIYTIVAKTVLWPLNSSESFVTQSFTGISSLQNDLELLNANMSQVADAFFPAVKKLVAHADKFLHYITVDQQFYE